MLSGRPERGGLICVWDGKFSFSGVSRNALPFGEGDPVGGGRGKNALKYGRFWNIVRPSSVTATPCHLPQRGRL